VTDDGDGGGDDYDDGERPKLHVLRPLNTVWIAEILWHRVRWGFRKWLSWLTPKRISTFTCRDWKSTKNLGP